MQHEDILTRFFYLCAIKDELPSVNLEADASPVTAINDFSSLDADSILAIVDHLPTRVTRACLDRRSGSLVALASTCKLLRDYLQPTIKRQQDAHAIRLKTLDSICVRLGTSLKSIRAARKSFGLPGEGSCYTCESVRSQRSGLFVRTRCERQGRRTARPRSDEADEVLADGEAHCVHCWRARFELTMRPMATGHEQTWEEEVDYSAGGWMMVEDFSTHDNLDSPLLAREEYSEVWPFANELVDELCASGYVLVGACHEMREEAHAAWAMSLSEDVREALVTWDLSRSVLLADLLASGYGDQLVSIDLSSIGLDDAGLELLAHGLVGNALQLQFIDLSSNPLGDDGVCALAALLAPRHFELMLPLLRWLHLVLEPNRLGDRGACALAAAMSSMAMPSLEVLWATSACFDEALAAPPEEILEGRHPGFAAITAVCMQRNVSFELNQQGVEWGGHHIAQNALI